MQTEIVRREIRHRRQQPKPKPLRGGYHMAGMSVGIGIGLGSSGAGVTPPPGSSGGPTDPLTIITSKTWLTFISADIGVTSASSRISKINDQSGANKHAIQATGGAQPLLNVSSLNTHNSWTNVSSRADRLAFNDTSALDLPAPGTTPTWMFGVMRMLVDTSGQSFWGATNTTTMRCLRGAALQYRQNNGTNGGLAGAIAVNSWYLVRALYSNAVGDYLKFGNVTVGTGTATGNNDPASGAFTLGSGTAAGATASDTEWACFGICNGDPSGAEQTALISWVTGYYSNLVIV